MADQRKPYVQPTAEIMPRPVRLIDGNKLKEKAVPLLFPTEMEPCGHLPDPGTKAQDIVKSTLISSVRTA